MRVLRVLAAASVLVWVASGFFIIRGNEQGLVRRFGRAQRAPSLSGLHFDLPWPLSQVDRVNVQEMRTLTIGVAALDAQDPSGFLRPTGLDRVGEFLTGDKNLLNLQVHLQYRIADPYRWLCTGEAPEVRLRLLTESRIAEAVAQSGVDYVHPLGLNELRQLLARDVAQTIAAADLGAVVEDVTIAAVWPPIEVKASFLDVSNARAEKEKLIEQERSRAEQRISAAEAQARQLHDRAETEKRTQVESARGAADRFRSLVAAMQPANSSDGSIAAHIRTRAMQRMFLDTLDQIWPKLARTLVIETDQPVDLRVFPETRRPSSREP